MKPERRGRGSQDKVHNPFESREYIEDPEYQEWQHQNGENPWADEATQYTEVNAKSIVNAVLSPDLGHKWSLNPYQGCEHGCSYCYARNTHTYWALDAGLDFERQILVKRNAADLLARHFEKGSWQPEAIMLSGNTDCYQPLERKLEITRSLLKVFLEYRNPVGIVTKNTLIERDLDLIIELNKLNLVHVAFSLNSLNEDLRRKMEPRTATAKRRLALIKKLSDLGIPVQVLIAPIIPGLNSHEVLSIAEKVAAAGARNISYTILRLNGQVKDVFLSWLEKHYPDRYQKVYNLVAASHDGQLNDSKFGRRMHGHGEMAEQIKQSILLARKRYFAGREIIDYNYQAFRRMRKGQYRLFD